MPKTAERTLPGQIRMNLWTGDLIIPQIVASMPDIELREIKKFEPKKEKPSTAFINSENLAIINNRVLKNGWPIDTSSEEKLIQQLVVFQYGTRIKLKPKEEEMRGYSIKLNIGVIACRSNDLINDYETPFGYSEYKMLGVYASYKATNRVSTDKCTRSYATIQRSDKEHPEQLPVGECFFAQIKDRIEVKKSRFEKTGYWPRK